MKPLLRRTRNHLSPGLVIALVALVVALGGTNPTGTALYARRDPDGSIVLIGRQVRDYQDMIYGTLPHGAVPAGTADGRIGCQNPLLLFGGTV